MKIPAALAVGWGLRATALLAQDEAGPPAGAGPQVTVTAESAAAGSRVILNEVSTDRFPTVSVFVTVLKDGSPVRGLGAADFRVREDEVDQGPLRVEAQLPPLSVVLAIDTSGSMRPRMAAVREAAQAFLDNLQANDSVEVIGFARTVNPLTPMSSDRALVRRAIEGTVARGDTALYDALYQSIEVTQGRPGRKAVVLLSDGVDDDGTGRPLSSHSWPQVVEAAKEANVPVYTIGLGQEIDRALLASLAQITGGLFFPAPGAAELRTLYDAIGAQLAGQYHIIYASNLPADGSIHRVQVRTGSLAGVKPYRAPLQRPSPPLAVEGARPVPPPAAPVATPRSVPVAIPPRTAVTPAPAPVPTVAGPAAVGSSGGSMVRLDGDGVVLSRRLDADACALYGSRNQVRLSGRVDALTIYGDANTVTVERVRSIRFVGRDNRVTYRAPNDGAAPQVSGGEGNGVTAD